MPPDPPRLADTESWMHKASNDLRCAAIDLAVDPPATEDAVFHCQPGSRESSQGLPRVGRCAISQNTRLGKLGQLATQVDATIEHLIERIVDLSKYAWMFRYPGQPIVPTKEEASEVLSRATSAVEEIRARISGPAPPLESQSA